MKQLIRIVLSSCLFLFLLLFPGLHLEATPAPDEVAFTLRSEDVATQAGQVQRVYFNLQKGTKAVPVSVTTTIEYDTEIYRSVQSADIVPTSLVKDSKAVSANLESNAQGIIRVGVGVEDYNDQPLPDGDLFYLDFKLLPGAVAQEGSIDINGNIELGPNQASTNKATPITVVNSAGVVFDDGSSMGKWDDSSSKKAGSCFINSLY